MEHPLITDADSLSMEELQTRVSDLSKKLMAAHRLGNAHLRHQVQMALDTYQSKLNQRQAEELAKLTKNNPGLAGKIDIS